MTGLPPIEIHLVQELREKALAAIQEKGEESYHPMDLKRIKEDDHSVWAFLVHQRREVSWAFDMLMECLKWRKEFGVNDIKDSEFPQFFDDIGAMYVLNTDKQGHRLIIMHVRRYRKEPIIANLARRYFVYNLEKLVKEDDRHRVSILFDLHGAGLNNVDMDFLFFMFNCFKTYYPSAVAHILVFDMPWIFTAMWKVVKGWLNSRAVAKIKFINKNSVLEYIDADQLLEEFGGKMKPPVSDEDFKANMKIVEKEFGILKTFKEIPESEMISQINMSNKKQEQESSTPDVAKKKNFSLTMLSKYKLTWENSPDIGINPLPNSIHLLTAGFTSKKRKIALIISQIMESILFHCSPAHELLFSSNAKYNSECSVSLSLTNIGTNIIAYKVRTTSPVKYRVRPSMGMIRPNTSVEILVNLSNDFSSPRHSVVHDKFLVMAMPVESDRVDVDGFAAGELSELWHKCPRDKIIEHKIRCGILPETPLSGSQDSAIDSLVEKVEVLLSSNASLQKEMKSLRRTIYAVVGLHILIVILFLIFIQLEIIQVGLTSNVHTDYCSGNNRPI